jgi:hypothetical protein
MAGRYIKVNTKNMSINRINHALKDIYPATVKSYDANTRTVRIEIPPLTYGAQTLPEAVICYGIGDKADHTEIRILAGDKVWVQFINGDARFPMVIGYRAPETNNANEWRKFHHANFRFDAITGEFVINAAGQVRIESASAINIIAKTAINLTAPAINISGAVTIVGGSLTHNGKNVGDSHTHPQNSGDHFGGGANTGSPQ